MSLSGQTKVSVAGTAVPLGDQVINAAVVIGALDTNVGIVAIGNVANDVTMSNGLRLTPGEFHVVDYLGNLSSLWLDAENANDGVAWLILNA